MEQATMFFSTHQAAKRLGLSARTLERYRGTGEGPVFYRFGRHVRYLQADLDAWARTRRRTSTRDEGNACGAAARWYGRRWLRRASGDRQGRRGPLRATHRMRGAGDVQRGGARRMRRLARSGRADDLFKRDYPDNGTLQRRWNDQCSLVPYDRCWVGVAAIGRSAQACAMVCPRTGAATFGCGWICSNRHV